MKQQDDDINKVEWTIYPIEEKGSDPCSVCSFLTGLIEAHKTKERNMKQWWVMLALLVSATALNATAEPSQQSANAKALNRWLGSWKSLTLLKPAAWSLKSQELSGTSKSVWILDGHFQQTSSRSGNHETREIHRYDASSNQYHKWVFDSDGSHSFWIGNWDEESSTMTWEYVDFGARIEGKLVDRFINDGKYQSTLILKDRTGNVLLDIQSEHVRTKKPAK